MEKSGNAAQRTCGCAANVERATAGADPPGFRGKPPTVGKRTANAPTVSAGIERGLETREPD